MTEMKEALAGQGEGTTKKPGTDSVSDKATRHARAKVARRGTVAADRRIVIEDAPTVATIATGGKLKSGGPPHEACACSVKSCRSPLSSCAAPAPGGGRGSGAPWTVNSGVRRRGPHSEVGACRWGNVASW